MKRYFIIRTNIMKRYFMMKKRFDFQPEIGTMICAAIAMFFAAIAAIGYSIVLVITIIEALKQ